MSGPPPIAPNAFFVENAPDYNEYYRNTPVVFAQILQQPAEAFPASQQSASNAASPYGWEFVPSLQRADYNPPPPQVL
jgi:hypothetical protein